MAMSRDTSYLTRELEVDVDQYLWRSTTHGMIDDRDMRKPPGVKNLQGWGDVKAPQGKHGGKKFHQIYEEDPQYVNQLWNRTGVSSWVRSFQLYCRHRRAASREALVKQHAKEQEQMPIPPASSTHSWQAPQPKASSPTDSTSWQMVSPRKTQGYVKTENKRTPDVLEEKKGMMTDPDVNKVQALQTQIAILQRELQKEMSGAQPSQKSGQPGDETA